MHEKKPRIWLRIIILLLAMSLITMGLGYKKYLQIQQKNSLGNTASPPTPVTTAIAAQAQSNTQLKAIGTLVAMQGVDISSEVSGRVKEINFESGQQVKQDQLLVSLNNELETAALHKAQSEFSSADNEYQRSLKLKNKKFVTENKLDLQKLAVDSALSQLESAKASLDKKSIKAPFSGSLGIREVDKGGYISPGMKLVSLQSVEKLFLDLTLPEQSFKELAVGQTVKFEVRSYPDQYFQGKVQAWNPVLDTNTRNVKVRAIVDNSARLLAPGMFAQAQVQSTNFTQILLVPETAIFYNIYGEAVYVLEKPETVNASVVSKNPDDATVFVLASRKVKVFNRENGKAGIIEGLKEGALVVTSGQLKLFPGMRVRVVDDVREFSSLTDDAASIK